MQDPRQTIATAPLSRLQFIAIAVCVIATALDGFDVLSISFASPGIAEEWKIDKAALGVVLSMELVGMAVGSIIIGALADKIGRRPVMLGCLVAMALGMALAAVATDVVTLSAVRFATGIGIGGMLAATAAMVAEYANARTRNFAVAAMATGYPLGAAFGGAIASSLLVDFDWRSVFVLGAALTAGVIPLVYAFLPESVEFLVEKRPRAALERVNALLRRMGRAPVISLPPPQDASHRSNVSRLFAPDLVRATVLLTAAYFAHIVTFYFILKWTPKIVVDLGYSPSVAGGVLVWTSLGGATGAIILGFLTSKYQLRSLIIGVLFLSAVSVAAFGAPHSSLTQLTLVAATAGFFTNSAIVGLYALFAQSFPTEVRAGGTGFVIGVGRGGAMMAPMIAGVLLQNGMGLLEVALLMASGSVLAAALLLYLGANREAEKARTGA
ncbi:MAG TPA: MFS transporter [Parvularcula sp.]|nr:MFS transporter [Parvularcula sp.]